ncbi:PilZ domain-containing protein [Rhodoferax sp.]|uniref:PilZ domain-containing protein n=1 Tax=Rhodoferax sp. TaxID=50421 RepID=UPI002ACE88D0|nr:PilZ domain-containing protein [Rhodoferax sp.]MDZ7920306.1 PilZ domain-containing protein [Rhodoferax sp.]
MSTENDTILRMPLKSLGLRSGMALQTRRLVEGTSKKEAQYFGAIEGKGVMVGPQSADATQTGMEEGEVCVVRGFTGQYEFSFLSKVLQTFEKPFAYALLAYPAQVDAKRVRQSMRTKVSWPTTARPASSATVAPHLVDLVDISTEGAMISTPEALGAIGELVELVMDVAVDGSPVQLRLRGKICHHNRPAGQAHFFAGLAFQGTSQNDKLVLNYLTQTAAN